MNFNKLTARLTMYTLYYMTLSSHNFVSVVYYQYKVSQGGLIQVK
jgi:hypothetical protein